MRLRLFLCFVLALTLGCRQQAITKYGQSNHASDHSVSRNLTKAIDYLVRMDEFDETEAHRQVVFLVNRWLDGLPDEEWTPDPFTRRLPRQYREAANLQDLDRKQIYLEDVRVMQQAVWLRDLSKGISSTPGDPLLEKWIEEQTSLGSYETSQLLVANRLFDWTVRNIQLDELLQYPTDAAAGPGTGTEHVERPDEPPPMRGIAGPGYQFQPWQSLLYGRGDGYLRARLFILLCRQQGIDAAMLGFPGQSIPPRPRPWLPVALVGGQLYLFDTQLGLPIPGPSGQGIATLEQVIGDPHVLDALTVGEEFPYTIAKEDLDATIALMDVAPTDLSHRMELIEEQLAGEYRLVLTVKPSALADRLSDAAGVDSVAFWRAPIEACWYWTALQRKMSEDPRIAAEHMYRYGMFETRNPLLQARHLHFRWILGKDGEEPNAIERYLIARVPDSQIVRFHELPDLQRQFGLQRERGENDRSWAARVLAVKTFIGVSKQHASYWLGLVQYDLQRYDSAIEWLSARSLEAYPNGPWEQGSLYNLGRALEAKGDLVEARKRYLSSEGSPQHHGNLVRARLLARRIAEDGGSADGE